jgi:lysine 2,3-aminomutase
VETGIKILEGMRGHTSGLAIPTFVVDLPHGGGKVPLHPDYVVLQTAEELLIRNYEGRLFHYRNPKAPKPGAGKANGHHGRRNGSTAQTPINGLASPSKVAM